MSERSFGGLVRALYRRDVRRLKREYPNRAKAAMTTVSGVRGGYLVPSDLADMVLTEASEHSFFLRLGTKVPMPAQEVTVPHVAVTGGAAGVSPFFGGVTFNWSTEAQAIGETAEPAFMATTLKAHELTGYALASNELLDDAGDDQLSDYLTQLLGRAAAWAFDYACWRGDGVGKPRGLLTSPAALDVTRTAGGDVQQADLAKMAAKLLPVGFGGFGGPVASWGFHPSVTAKLFAVAGWQISQPAAAGDDPKDPGISIQGWRACCTEKLPALGTRGDMVLFIPELFLVGVRQEVEVSVSRDEPTAFTKNQSVIRVVFRGDGQPRLNASVTLADGAQTASSIVVLN